MGVHVDFLRRVILDNRLARQPEQILDLAHLIPIRGLDRDLPASVQLLDVDAHVLPAAFVGDLNSSHRLRVEAENELAVPLGFLWRGVWTLDDPFQEFRFVSIGFHWFRAP